MTGARGLATRDREPRPGPPARGAGGPQLLFWLQRHGLAYCIVGAARYGIDERCRDIDIVVRPADIAAVARILRQFCRSCGGRVVNVVQHEAQAHYFTCAWTQPGEPPAWMSLDVHAELSVGDRRLCSADEVLAGRVLTHAAEGAGPGLPIAAPAVEVVYSLAKQIHRRAMSDAAATRLSAEWHRDPEGARTLLSRWLSGAELALVSRAAASGDWHEVVAQLPRLRGSWRRRLPRAAPWARATRVWRRVRRPTGLTVAFLGIDGVGKSTVIRGVMSALTPVFARAQYFHFKPQVIPVSPRQPEVPMVHPQGKADGLSLRSLVRLGYYLLDYWIGYAGKVWLRRARTTLVMFDRYFYDLSIDPVRLRHRWSMALAGWLARAVPSPDLVIVLDAPPEVVRSRKQEVPCLEEGTREREEYLRLAKRLPNAHVVDATEDDTAVVRRVQQIILDHMARRAAARLGP